MASLGGCASAAKVPGTGDVSFRLSWSGPADLDLHVEDPAGEELSFVKRWSESGGVLDIDCNSGPEDICRHPMENIYWPPGVAPEGRYRYRVEFFQSLEKVEDVTFELEVRCGETVVERRAGRLSTSEKVAGPFEYDFLRPRSAGNG